MFRSWFYIPFFRKTWGAAVAYIPAKFYPDTFFCAGRQIWGKLFFVHCARCVAATVEEDLERGRKSRKYRLAPGVEKVGGRGEECEIGKLLLKKRWRREQRAKGNIQDVFRFSWRASCMEGRKIFWLKFWKNTSIFRISRGCDAPFPNYFPFGKLEGNRLYWEGKEGAEERRKYSFPGSILERGEAETELE